MSDEALLFLALVTHAIGHDDLVIKYAEQMLHVSKDLCLLSYFRDLMLNVNSEYSEKMFEKLERALKKIGEELSGKHSGKW